MPPSLVLNVSECHTLLHKKMEEGFVIDYLSIGQEENVWPNVGAKYFQLIKEPSAND